MKKFILALFVTVGLYFSPCFTQEAPNNKPKVVKMVDIKQTLTGLDKEYSVGDFVKVKVSPLPDSANIITAIYKLSLLENGKLSKNCEAIIKSDRTDAPKRDSSDFAFSIRPNCNYKVLFAATYIETKAGTKEIVETLSPDISVFEVKVGGVVPGPDVNPDIPSGTYGMIRIIYAECQKLPFDKATKITLFTALKNCFANQSTKIAAGVYKDSADDAVQAENVNKFLTDSKVANNKAIEDSKADRTKFDGTIDIAVKDKLNELFASGKLRKLTEYQVLWAEIAEGFSWALKGLE